MGFAYFVQYALGFEPCILCLYQRIPYFVLTILSIAGLVLKNYNLLARMVLVTLFSSILLAAYHTGIERGIISPTETCNAGFNIPEGASADEIRDILYEAPLASCTKAAMKIFALSMTEWNLLLSAALFAVTLRVMRKIE